jgi:uncharacterized protein YegJ (DUF2314 family)
MVRSNRSALSLIALTMMVLLLPACGGPQSTATIDSNNVIAIREGNQPVELAKQQAIAELPEFFQHLDSPKPNETEFGVKFDLTPDGYSSEFIWAGELKRDGDVLEGVLTNTPSSPGFSLGQSVRINASEIIDWGYRSDGIMQGHYTTKALAQQLNLDEAEKLNKYYGWDK